MCLASNVKKFEFWRARLWGNPRFGTLNFVWFSLFLISNHSKNFIHFIGLHVQKF